MCPIFAIEENLSDVPVLVPGAVPIVNPRSPLHGVVETYLSSQIPNKKTARGYRRHIKAALDMMGVETFADLQPFHLMQYCSDLMGDSRGAATHAQALIAVRSFLQWGAALRGHDLSMDQVRYLLPVPKVTVITPHETLDSREIPRFLTAAKQTGKREHALALVALGSGVRVAELVALDIKDIRNDASGGTTIHVRQGKGGKDRMVPVRKEVRAAVDLYLEFTHRSRKDMGPLFLSEDRAMLSRDSWRLTTKSASRIVKTLAEMAGIDKRISPHALRHTFAFNTYLYCRNLVAVQKLLGHATIATTQRYVAHLDELDLRSATPAYLVGARGPKTSPALRNHAA
jgi:site-specific recombinase XerD